MTPHLTLASHRRTSAFVLSVLLLTAALTASISSSAHAATPLLDIAYSTGGNIWTQRADGTKTQLTSTTDTQFGDTHPDVSPDGLSIAYSAKAADSNNEAIWIMGIDGSGPRQMTSPTSPTASDLIVDVLPRWSPDGTRVVFNREGLGGVKSFDLLILNVSSGSVTALTTDHHALGAAAWSPDSRRLVFWDTDQYGLSIIGADGSGEHLVSLQAPTNPQDPEWSHDGNTIYFLTGSEIGGWVFSYKSSDQFTTTLDTAAQNLLPGPYYYSNPRLTPDGKSLGFTRNGDVYTMSLADGTLSQQPLVNVDGFSFIPPKVCAPVMFVGVRGSGETASDADGYGSTVDAVRRKLATYFPGMNSHAIDYPAIPIDYFHLIGSYGSHYVESVANGRAAIDQYLTDTIKFCPTAKIIIAGYSQGAHVAGDAYDYLTAADKAHVSAVLLFGDARFNPKQKLVDSGTYTPAFSGVYQFVDSHLRLVDKAWVKNVANVCLQGDPVCNYSLLNAVACGTGICPHLMYEFFGWTTSGADWAACMVATSPTKQTRCNRP